MNSKANIGTGKIQKDLEESNNHPEFRESETVELKRSTSELKEAITSIASILNKHQRGELYFGLRNDGRAIGQDVTEKTIRDVTQAISNHIEPRIYPEIYRVSIDGRSCISVRFNGMEIPYYAYGRAYMRVGDEDRKLSAKEVEKIILTRQREQLRWDNQICAHATMDDISTEKVKRFTNIAGVEFISSESTLSKLGLFADGTLLNTAVMVFAQRPEKFFPCARLRCAVFGGTDTAVIIDRHEYAGDLLHLIEQAEKYILENIHIGMRVDGLYRSDVPEIDRKAFREAIINAFCHRDYNRYDAVSIAIFTDRVEIRSPGGLFGGLTIEQITTEMISIRRNEIIADMLHRLHFVERWGRGISLIRAEEPTASFKEVADVFITTFKRKESAIPDKVKTEEIMVVHSPNLKKLLTFCNEPHSRDEILKALKLRDAKHLRENIIQPALESGILEMTLPEKPRSKNQRYRTTEKGKKAIISKKE